MIRSFLTFLRACLLNAGAATAAVAADPGQPLLDLATCHGSTLPAEVLAGEGEDADRFAAMIEAYSSVRDPERFRPSEVPNFWTPVDEVAVAGFPVEYVGTDGFGIFVGPSLTLDGAFDEVREALADVHALEYGNCRSQGPLEVCTTEVATNQTRLIMSHPTEPAGRTVLVCVERTLAGDR